MPNDSTREEPRYRLLILGDGSVRTVPLTGDHWTIGRSPECAVTLRDPTVSRKHILLERDGERFRFQDLGGANPILLDGRPTKQGEITVGQTISVGLTRLTLERREGSPAPQRVGNATVVLSREVIDEELQPATAPSFSTTARRVLERIEWTFADLGDLSDAAEPLLDLAMNLTAYQRGWVGRLRGHDVEMLAMLDSESRKRSFEVPDSLVAEAHRINQPHLLTTRDADGPTFRLIVPLGAGPDGLLVLEKPRDEAPAGQELLRLSRSLGHVVWHRLQETAERLRLRDELQRLRFHGTAAHNALLTSTRLQLVRERLRALASGDGPILLVGEEGTEREDLARYLHAESPRHQGPFVPMDAARLAPWRHERDLFGDARSGPAAIHRARGGTLFVDNVASLTTALQQRLVERLQAMSAEQDSPPRLVLASSQSPEADRGAWCDALLEWIDPTPVLVPPLRSDSRDVLALAELFLSEMGPGPGGSPRLLTERSKRQLVAHAWPGNVRELRLVLEAAAAQAGGQPIAPRHLPAPLSEVASGPPPTEVPTLDELERHHIIEVMQRTGGNRSRAAQMLGIASSTLYEKLKRYALDA